MADIDSLLSRAEKLEERKAQLQQELSTVEAPKSDHFKIDYRFKGAESLQGEEKRRYQLWWEHVRALYEIVTEPLTRGGRYRVDSNGSYVYDDKKRKIFDPFPHKVLDVYNLRNWGYSVDQLIINLLVYHDVEAFDFLRDMSLGIAKWTVTEYSWPVSEEAKKMELPGTQKFINWIDGDKDGRSGFSRALDNNLSFGTFCEVNLAFKTNPERIKIDDAKRFENLTLDLLKQMYYASIIKYGSQKQKDLWGKREVDAKTGKVTKPARCDTLSIFEIMDIYNEAKCPMDLERWGHSLLHPTQSMYTGMHALWLTYKRREFRESRDRLGKMLKDVRFYVDSPYGEMMVQPHKIPARAKYLHGSSEGIMKTQDITYFRESQPKHAIAVLLGAPHVSWREAGSLCRTYMWCGLFQGPQGPRIAASIGGRYEADESKYADKNYLILEGKKAIPSKMALGWQALNDYISSATRGMNAIGLCAAQDEDLVKRVKLMNDGPDPKKIRSAASRGNDMCILLYEHFKGKNLVS